jgi:nicotinate-nucleotide adenylyltransferase
LRAGIFGGTFDPPHLGHVILAREAARQLQLDQVFWVLTPDPPHKQGHRITAAPLREAMVRASIVGHPEFVYSDVDFRRPAPLYAVDTMREFRQQFPDAYLAYIMGEDSLDDLPRWHTPREFVAECDGIAVMQRVDRELNMEKLEESLPGLRQKTIFLKIEEVEISSSQLRARVAHKQNWQTLVDPLVAGIIEENHLYQ